MLELDYNVKNGMVMIPEPEFRAWKESLEMQLDVAAYDHAMKNLEECYPLTVAKDIANGKNPVLVFRKFRSLSQVQLAEKVGVTQAYISDIENEHKDGSFKVMKAIASALDVDLDELA